MAADSPRTAPTEATIRVSSQTRERLRGWGDAEQHDEELLRELLDRVEQESPARSDTWPTGDYY